MAETQDQEHLSKKIKHNLENWREIILPLNDILLWKNISVYPGLIFGTCTFLFILIILIDPTLLSFVSTICLIAVITDYIVPIAMTKVFNADSWTGAKEKKLEEISTNIAVSYLTVRNDVSHFFSLKESRPKVYYSVLICVLLFLSWLGNNVNNVFLTYLVVTSLLMLPGLKQNGYLQKFQCLVKQYIEQAWRTVRAKKEKKP